MNLEQAKARIKSGARFGDVYPNIFPVAGNDPEELRRWFCHEHEWQPKVEPPSVDQPKLKTKAAKELGFTGNACHACFSFMMTRNGNCERCMSCGATSGCS